MTQEQTPGVAQEQALYCYGLLRAVLQSHYGWSEAQLQDRIDGSVQEILKAITPTDNLRRGGSLGQ